MKRLILTLAILFSLLSPVSAQETYRGAVFETNPENLTDIINDLKVAGIDIGIDKLQKSLLAQFGAELPVAGIMLSKNGLFILISDEKLKSGYYEIHGGTLPPILVGGTVWTPLKVFEYRRLPAVEVTVANLKSNPERYLFKEVRLTATLTEFSFSLDYEGVLIPISVGLLSDVEPDPDGFASELVNVTKDLLTNPSWERVVQLSGKYTGIPAFRIQEEYWKNARAEITGFVLTPEVLNAWVGLTLLDPSSFDWLLPTGSAVVILNEVNIVSERAEVPDILANSAAYSGKIVEIEVSGMGTDVSVRRLLQVVSAPSIVIPVAMEFVQRVNVFLEGEVIWKPVVPGIGNLLYASGTRSYSERPPDTLIIPLNELDGRYIVRGAVVSAKSLDPTLPNAPMLIVFEKRRVGDVEPADIPLEVKEKILTRLKELEVVFTGEKTSDSPDLKSSLSDQPTPTKTPESIMTSTPPDEVVRNMPGFGVIAVIVAVFLVFVVTRRR